jgi:hypothetical protein
MKSGGHFDSDSGLSVSRSYLGSLDAVVKAYEPALKGVGRYNLEVLALISRRAQAWLGVPSRLVRCVSPVDVMREQMQFWQSAAADYAQAVKRLSAAVGGCAVLPEFKGLPTRDFITVEEPAAASGKRSDRKAA